MAETTPAAASDTYATQVRSRILHDVFIDPTDGSDSTADETNINTPRKTIPSTWVAGYRYNIICGCTITLTSQIDIDASNVTLASYGIGPRPILDGVNLSDIETIKGSADNLSYIGLHVKSPYDGAASTLFKSGTTSKAVCIRPSIDGVAYTSNCSGLTVIKCILEGQADIGSDCTALGIVDGGSFPLLIHGNEIYNCSNGIFIKGDTDPAGTYNYVTGNYVHDFVGPLSSLTSSDGIAFGCINVGTVYFDFDNTLVIAGNTIHGYYQNAIDTTSARNVIIEYNDLGNLDQSYDFIGNGLTSSACILCGYSSALMGGDVTVRNNYIHNIQDVTDAIGDAIVNRHTYGYMTVTNNLVVDAKRGFYSAYQQDAGTLTITNNSFIDINSSFQCVRIENMDATVNYNVGTGADYGIFGVNASYTISYDYNDFYGMGTAAFGGTSTEDDGGHNITSDPSLDTKNFPTAGAAAGMGCQPLTLSTVYTALNGNPHSIKDINWALYYAMQKS